MRHKRSLITVAVLVGSVALATPWAVAAQLGEFYRGVRAMGMGNAYTAVADDADAVLYNPAGLALNPNYDFRLINPKVDVTTDDISVISELRTAAAQLDGPTLSKLFGKHIYAGVGAFPMIQFPYFAIGYYYNVQARIVSRNLAYPAIEASYLRDNGLIGGLGWETRGFSKRHFLRLGLGLKWLTRQGFDKTIPLTELVVADKDYLTRLATPTGTGWGTTFGFQYEMALNRSNNFILASSWQDIGDTTFGNSYKINKPPPIRSNLSAGGAFVHRFNPSFRAVDNIKVAAELRHLTQANIDPRLRMHAGVEISISDLSLQGGWSQDSLTGGVKLDMWFLEIAAVTYGVENQSLAFMDRERRYMLQTTLKFDIMGKQSRSVRDEHRRKHPREY